MTLQHKTRSLGLLAFTVMLPTLAAGSTLLQKSA